MAAASFCYRLHVRAALRRIAIATLVASSPGLVGCAAKRKREGPPPGVTVILHGDQATRVAVRRELDRAELPVELRFVDPPNRTIAAPASPAIEPAIASARAHWVAADFDACVTELADEAVIDAALEVGERTTAARVLLWRIACHTGAGADELARAQAMTMATWDLPVPEDVGAMTPEVEATVGAAMTAVHEGPRATLEVRSNASDVPVRVDGKTSSCRTPCKIDLPPGDHHVALAGDGWVSTSRHVRLDAKGTAVEVVLAAAGPELASAQWTWRYGNASTIDASGSMSLLARATRARRLVLLGSEGGAHGRVRGVLATDGKIEARAERTGPSKKKTPPATAVMRELLIEGKVVAAPRPIYKRPVFWIAIILSAAAAATLTGLLTREPDHRTVVEFK